MLVPVLLVLGLQLTCSLGQGSINFRHYCTSQHSASKYKVSCNGNQHFKDKNMVLDSRNTNGITDIELYSFESITIDRKTASGWNTVKKIAIRNCSMVSFISKSLLLLEKLEIDSVDILSFESEQPHYIVDSKVIIWSNIGSLRFISDESKVKGDVFTLSNVKDANFQDKLNFLGMLLIITQSNINLMEHTNLSLTFDSITLKDSTKLYIQESGQLSLKSDKVIIQESYIYIDGKVSCVMESQIFGATEGGTFVKFLNSSIYGMEEKNVHISENFDNIAFIGNGIYRSDISSVMALVDLMQGVTFSKNDFNCNECKNGQLLQSKYLEKIGGSNFCDASCNLTLSRFKDLLNEGGICGQGEMRVTDEILCSTNRISVKESIISTYLWWIIPVIFVFFVCLTLLLYFYFKRNSPRFQSIPVKRPVPSYELQNRKDAQKERAFSNEVYGKVDESDNIYEIVDPP